MRAKLLAIVALALLLSLGLAQTAYAATPIYVRPGGDDTLCNGTVDADWGADVAPDCAVQTIQKGVDLVDAGGTVYVAAGTYPETVLVNKSVELEGAQAGNPVSGRTAGSENESIIDARGLSKGVIIMQGNVTVDGFDILGDDSTYGIEADAGYGPDDIALTANDNIVTGCGVGIEIYRCETDCDSGVFTSVSASGNCLSDNTYGIRSNVTDLVTNGTNNWWGDASGPYHPTQNPGGLGDEVSDFVAFVPWLDDCGGDPIANFQNVRTEGYYSLLQDAVDDAIPGDTILTIGPGPFGAEGHAEVVTNDVTIKLNGRTFGRYPEEDIYLKVVADDVTVLGPGLLDGWDGSAETGFWAIRLTGHPDNFILQGVEIKRWGGGVSIAHESSVISFKMADNFIHNNTSNGLNIGDNVSLGGVVTIEGNLFKDNGDFGVRSVSTSSQVPVQYNSWGDLDGPEGPLGDGYCCGPAGNNVIFDPWTFAEIYLDMDPDTEAVVRHVAETSEFDVRLKADAAKLYGLTFVFTYDTDKLTLNSTTFAAPWAGRCTALPGLPAGTVGYYCYLMPPAVEWSAAAGTIATFNFTAYALPDDNPVTTYFDLSHLQADTSASAIGGVKVFVNNAGFNAPSLAERDITDTDDGRISIEPPKYAGFVDLQGRANDSGAVLEVYNQQAISGAIKLAQGTSASSGAYTTEHVSLHLVAGTTYWLVVDRALYLPTTPVTETNYLHSEVLGASPPTALPKATLLGGDAYNDNYIDISDLSCIGYDYGKTSGFSTCDGTGLSDVNGDGKVNIQDLSLSGGNYYKAASPWPWTP